MICFLCGCDIKGISHLPVVDGNSYTVCDMCFLEPIILQNINKKIVFKKAEDARETTKINGKNEKIMEQEFIQMYKELREVFTPDEIKRMTEKIKNEESFRAGRQSGKTIMMREDMKKRMYDVIGDVKEEAKKEAEKLIEGLKGFANFPPPVDIETIEKLNKFQEEYSEGDTVYTKCDNDVKYISVEYQIPEVINLNNTIEKLKKKIKNQRAELRRLNKLIKTNFMKYFENKISHEFYQFQKTIGNIFYNYFDEKYQTKGGITNEILNSNSIV